MSARDFYLKQEAKRGFRGWRKEGLDFLLKNHINLLTTSQITLIKKQINTL